MGMGWKLSLGFALEIYMNYNSSLRCPWAKVMLLLTSLFQWMHKSLGEERAWGFGMNILPMQTMEWSCKCFKTIQF